MNIKVIDNFANIEEQLTLLKIIEKTDNYRFLSSSVGLIKNKTKSMIDYPHMTKPIFYTSLKNNIENCHIDSNFFSLIYCLLYRNNLSDYIFNRIKININFPFPNNTKENHGPIHTDFLETNFKGTSIIYYINNCDGDTVFFNKNFKEIKRVSPRQGRAVVFDSSINHAGSCPIYSPCRQVINFVLYK